MSLGGRVSERWCSTRSPLAPASDLDYCTDMARAMVCEYGMSDRLGPLRLGRRHGSPFLGRDLMEDRDYSEEVAQAIDEEVRESWIATTSAPAKSWKIIQMMDHIVEVLMVRRRWSARVPIANDGAVPHKVEERG